MRYSLDVPLKLNGHSSRCKWCANLLAPARRIWKVRDAHRYYCSEFCFLQGEERQLRYDAQLTGTVHLHGRFHLHRRDEGAGAGGGRHRPPEARGPHSIPVVLLQRR
jgi:hypothetical protein